MRVLHALASAAVVAGLVLAGVACPGEARAQGLTASETARLARGETVSRPAQLDLGGRHYVGGVSYDVVDGAPGEVAALLDDVAGWRRFLPRTRDARLVGEAGGDALVEITHGSPLLSVSYTLRLHREGNSVRFWMDAGLAHDIEDVWGYARAVPLPDGRTLLTWGILIDMGPGLLRDMFEGRVQALALQVPDQMRGAVLQRAVHGVRAAR